MTTAAPFGVYFLNCWGRNDLKPSKLLEDCIANYLGGKEHIIGHTKVHYCA